MKRTVSARVALAKRPPMHGFALATVLIASTVMLTVLLVAVQSTAAIRTALQTQYYNGLSRTAAESGIAYAKACLANNTSNPGAPQWTASKPLTVNTGCDGNPNGTCNASATTAACTVASNGDIVSNFSVAYPPLDASGRATSLTATGIVNVLRTSQLNTATAPWRVYKANSTTSLSTTAQCSAYNPATAGWSNVVATTESLAFPESTAKAISLSTSTLSPGPMFYRTDFNVATPGTYTLTTLADDKAEVSIDGQLVSTALYQANGTATSVNLSAGCHTLVAKVTNKGIVASTSKLTLSLKLSGASVPLIVTEATDTAWRVTTGSTVDFSQTSYYEDTSIWAPVRNFGLYNTSTNWSTGPTNWSAASDNYADWISTTGSTNAAGTTYPSASYTYFRNSSGFTVSASTSIKVTAACDDTCVIYLDGNQVLAGSTSTTAISATMTVAAGTHTMGVSVYNSSSSPSGLLMAVVRVSDSAVLMQTDSTWDSSNSWSTALATPQSYDATFVPTGVPTPVCTIACQSITNLLPNPSFETNATTNIGLGNGGTGSAVAKSSAYAASGTYSAAVTATSASSNDSSFNVGGDSGSGMQGFIAGHTYLMNATVKVPAALTGTLDSLNRAISENLYFYSTALGAYWNASAKAPNIAGVYNLSLTITLPADTTQVALRYYNGSMSGGGTVYWDALAVYDITSSPAPTSAYYDGNSPNWSWSGTQNLSSSSGPYYP